jgi:hypothetical protein
MQTDQEADHFFPHAPIGACGTAGVGTFTSLLPVPLLFLLTKLSLSSSHKLEPAAAANECPPFPLPRPHTPAATAPPFPPSETERIKGNSSELEAPCTPPNSCIEIVKIASGVVGKHAKSHDKNCKTTRQAHLQRQLHSKARITLNLIIVSCIRCCYHSCTAPRNPAASGIGAS